MLFWFLLTRKGDGRYGMSDVGCWMLDVRCRMSDVRCQVSDTGRLKSRPFILERLQMTDCGLTEFLMTAGFLRRYSCESDPGDKRRDDKRAFRSSGHIESLRKNKDHGYGAPSDFHGSSQQDMMVTVGAASSRMPRATAAMSKPHP
jgi:hypothetical protein